MEDLGRSHRRAEDPEEREQVGRVRGADDVGAGALPSDKLPAPRGGVTN